MARCAPNATPCAPPPPHSAGPLRHEDPRPPCSWYERRARTGRASHTGGAAHAPRTTGAPAPDHTPPCPVTSCCGVWLLCSFPPCSPASVLLVPPVGCARVRCCCFTGCPSGAGAAMPPSLSRTTSPGEAADTRGMCTRETRVGSPVSLPGRGCAAASHRQQRSRRDAGLSGVTKGFDVALWRCANCLER